MSLSSSSWRRCTALGKMRFPSRSFRTSSRTLPSPIFGSGAGDFTNIAVSSSPTGTSTSARVITLKRVASCMMISRRYWTTRVGCSTRLRTAYALIRFINYRAKQICSDLSMISPGKEAPNPFPSLNGLSQSYGRDFGTRSLPYLKRAEWVERSWVDRRFWLALERARSAGSARLLSFLFAGHESLQVEGLVPQKHVVDRSAQFGRENAQSLSLPVILLQASEVFLPYGVTAQEEGGRFGESPFEMDIAHLAAGLLFRLAGGLMGTLDQASVGDKVLDSGKAAEVVNLIEQGQREDLSNARDGAKKVELPVAVLADLVNQVEPSMSRMTWS